MSHYTEKFKKAYAKVLEVAKTEGIERGKIAFRDAMLELGHDERLRNLYRVKDKLTKKPVFFVPNAPQERYLKQRTKRNIILKCRQVGFTTLNCLRGLDLVLWEPNTQAGILCHKLSTVKTIFNDITKFAYEWFVKDWGKFYNPVQQADSATALSFKHDGLGRDLHSSILVLYDFRGKTIHFLHVSEAHFIENSRLIGSINGVPDNGEITYESTANGQTGEFYRLWQLWKNKGNNAGIRGFFVPWYVAYPENPDEWDREPQGGLTQQEEELKRTLQGKITNAHINWRRYCIEYKCGGDAELFDVEYPTNDLDCFLATAASVFPRNILKMQNRNVREPLFTGFLLANDKQSYDISENDKGIISIWEEPQVGVSYVIGADPSGGVGKDMGAAYVKNLKTGALVARLWADLTPQDFANELFKLANFYHKAFICVEANNYGHVVLHVLKEKGYNNLYKRAAIDDVTQKPTKKLGFLTTNESKLMITEKFKNACREGKVIIYDKDLIAEMSTFVQLSGDNRRSIIREALPDAHDDLVMAACLTEEAASSRKESETEFKYDRNIIFDEDTGFIVEF